MKKQEIVELIKELTSTSVGAVEYVGMANYASRESNARTSIIDKSDEIIDKIENSKIK